MTTTDDGATRSSGTAASHDFDRLLAEAIDIARRIADELANGEFPTGLDWGDVGDMAETVRGLRAVSDRLFAEDRGDEASGS